MVQPGDGHVHQWAGDTSAMGLRDSMLLLQTWQRGAGIRGTRACLAMQLPEPKRKAHPAPLDTFPAAVSFALPKHAQCCPKMTTPRKCHRIYCMDSWQGTRLHIAVLIAVHITVLITDLLFAVTV